jgi:hypothetical protein
MATTVAELIEKLQKWRDQNELVAYSIWSVDDIESFVDDLVGEPDAKDVWAKVVDELQQDFDEGYLVEKISENMYGYVYERYESA